MERFSTEPEVVDSEDILYLKIRQRLVDFKVPVGTSLLSALEQNKQPVIAACRAGFVEAVKQRCYQPNTQQQHNDIN